MLTPLRILPVVLAALVAAGTTGFFDGGLLDGLSDNPWAYALLGISAIVTEELSPIFAGIAAHEGELRFWRAVVAITLGGWGATSLLYLLGRQKWEYIRRRWPSTRAAGTVALRKVARNPIKASFFVRFAFGLRIVLPIACGAARVPLLVYLAASLLGSALWSLLFTFIGYVAGEAAVRVMGKLDRVSEVIGALVVTTVVILLMRWNRRRNERKLEKQRKRRVTDD